MLFMRRGRRCILLVLLAHFNNMVSSSDSSSTSILDQPFQDSLAHLETAACVTLFHRNGRVGCSTEARDVQTGQLMYYDHDGGSNSNFYSEEPYVAVIDEYDLVNDAINNIVGNNNNNGNGNNNGGLLRGILVLNSTNYDEDREKSYYSPASQTPRGYNTPSANLWYNGNNNFPWNANGQELLLRDFYGVPISYIADSDVSDAVRQYAQKGGNSKKGKDSIFAEFNYYMGPDGTNSESCLAWKDVSNDNWNPKCLPLGGASVWAVAGSPENEESSDDDDDGNNNNRRPIVMVSTAMDSTSMFHDIVPGVNSAASNMLTLLMAAKLIGGVSDNTLDNLQKRILFGFFQGESYGFIGSRAFLRDVAYPGFECDNDKTVRSVSNNQNSHKACLYPMRHDLEFEKLGEIAGMLSVDQVGVPVTDGRLFSHDDGNDGTFGYFISNVLKNSYTNDYTVSAASNEDNNNYGIPFPPTPLTALQQLSGGALDGAVLTGYDYAFSNQMPFHSHLESANFQEMNLDAIASAATLIARAAFAAAYDDGSFDYETSAGVAANRIAELSSDDETLKELANCLFYDGSCALLQQYSNVETANERARTGLNLGSGYPLGTPPNYYASIYNINHGQPFVQVGDYFYGAYAGGNYGRRNTDAVGIQPNVLARAIRGLLDDFLGRGSYGNYGEDNSVSCTKASDCFNINYCRDGDDRATCTGGGQCVCSRSHYHEALDEALEAKADMYTGYFVVKDDDEGYSSMYTEPYWSSNVGVRIFRNVGPTPGLITLACGVVVTLVCGFASFVVLVGLKKEKMYL